MFISIFPLFFIIRQVHTQPVITTNSNTTSRPIRAPAAGIAIFKGNASCIVGLSDVDGHVSGDAGSLSVGISATFVVTVLLETESMVDDGHTFAYSVVDT